MRVAKYWRNKKLRYRLVREMRRPALEKPAGENVNSGSSGPLDRAKRQIAEPVT